MSYSDSLIRENSLSLDCKWTAARAINTIGLLVLAVYTNSRGLAEIDEFSPVFIEGAGFYIASLLIIGGLSVGLPCYGVAWICLLLSGSNWKYIEFWLLLILLVLLVPSLRVFVSHPV